MEYGNWSELQKIIPSTSIPEPVENTYVFQKNEFCYIPNVSWTQTGIYEGYIPTEAQFIDSLKKQIYAKQGARLLYCKLTIVKTMIGINMGRAYYKVDCIAEKLVVQSDLFGIDDIALAIIIAVVVAGVVIITFALLYPAIIYRLAGVPPEDVDKYNDAQAKLWDQLIKFANSLVALVAVAVVGFGVFAVYTGRSKRQNGRGR